MKKALTVTFLIAALWSQHAVADFVSAKVKEIAILATIPEHKDTKNALLLAECDKALAAYDHEDYDIALKELTPLANAGNRYAQYYLARIYNYGLDLEKEDYQKAVALFTLAANQGHSDAQYALADKYVVGLDVKRDYQKAVELYTLAANQGHEIARTVLGNMYAAGKGVEQDYAKAVALYTIASNNKNAYGQLQLAEMYKNGYGLNQDIAKAKELYTLSAEQGMDEAQYQLDVMNGHGEMLERRNNVVSTISKILKDMNAASNFKYGLQYYTGQGKTLDYAQAFELFTEAASYGSAEGQYYLGVMYEKGEFVKQDNLQAKAFLMLAANQGNEAAKKALAKYEK